MATFSERDGRHQAKIRRAGYPVQSATFRTKAAAQRWARDIESKMDAGAFSAPAAEARKMTLADAVDKYKAEVSSRKRGELQERPRLAMWRAHVLATRPLAKITPADVTKHADTRISAGKATNTVRLELALLSHIYSTARKRWQMPGLANPVMDAVKPSTTGTARTRRLQTGEEARLLWACRKAGPRWLPHVVILAIETAMRRGEIASLTPDRVRGNVAVLPMTKNGTRRDVPLSPRAQVAARRAMALKRGRPGMPLAHEISQRFAVARDAAGMPDLRFHDMRREGTSRLFARGWNIPDVAAVTGHKTWAMLEVYTKPYVEDLADRLAKKNPRSTEAPAG